MKNNEKDGNRVAKKSQLFPLQGDEVNLKLSDESCCRGLGLGIGSDALILLMVDEVHALLKTKALKREMQGEIPWPVKLDGKVGLTLCFKCRFVRANGQVVWMSISQPVFKTRRIAALLPA